MEIVTRNIRTLVPRRDQIHFNIGEFIGENITRSWWLMAWLAFIILITVNYTIGQLRVAPATTIFVLVVWIVTVLMTSMAEVQKAHTGFTFWLKNNMYNSITNVAVSLLLTLIIIAAVRGFYNYAWVNASFSTEPIPRAQQSYETTVEEVLATDKVDLGRMPSGLPFDRIILYNAAGTPIRERSYVLSEDKSVVTVTTRDTYTGATWGSVIDNLANLLIFRYKASDKVWRIWAIIGLLVALVIPSIFIYRDDRFRRSPIRKVMTVLWLLSPIAFYILLRGYNPLGIEEVNPDNIWGGLLLSIIIAVFSIVVSFPIGVLAALGRRSTIRGIPWWLTYSLAGALTLYLLITTTPTNLASARNGFERVLAYWPLIIPPIAYLFQRNFHGNVVAAFSTIYIEVVRGVPFITVLFMAIILFPIFLPPGMEVLNTTRVLWAGALFAGAYLAENVRGGLQAIPKGQYEAADSLGLSVFSKYRSIILPQALRAVIPAIVGQFIGLFKDTSLVFLVGLFDFLAVANSISAQPKWLGIRTEPYILLIIVYFILSSLMSGYSRRLERQLGVGER